MKVSRLFNFNNFAASICLMIVVASLSFVNAQIDPLKSKIELSTVGVARGQTARLNVYYHDTLPPGPCTPGISCPVAFESCNAMLTFYFADGSVSTQRAVTLTPDKGASLVFTPTIFNTRDNRVGIRAEVIVAPDSSGYVPRIIPSVEVMDAVTGQTSLLNPGSLVGFNPQPEPPGDFNFGLFNVIKGQTARVSISYPSTPDDLPPGPCRVIINFYDGDGRAIGQSAQTLEAGKTAQFDFSTANLSAGSRVRIRAGVHVEMGDGRVVPSVISSLEIFDADTGKGSIFYPGKTFNAEQR